MPESGGEMEPGGYRFCLSSKYPRRFFELCTHFFNLQCLIDNVYQQPYFIMAAKQKRGFESNYKSLKKMNTLNLDDLNKVIMR